MSNRTECGDCSGELACMEALVSYGDPRGGKDKRVDGEAELPKSSRSSLGFLLVAGSNSEELETGKAGIRKTEPRCLER